MRTSHFRTGLQVFFIARRRNQEAEDNIPSSEQQKELARLTMKDLGLASNDIASLQKIEWA